MSDTLQQCFPTCIQGFHASWDVPESRGCFIKISRTWKVLENEFGPGKY